MALTNTPAAAAISMVHVHDPRVRWSVRAERVLRIVPASERAAPAIDVLARLRAAPPEGTSARRVLLVRGAGDGELALLAAGAIEVGEVDPAAVLPLPAELATHSPQVSAIVVAHDASLSLLLDPSAVTPDDTVLGEELCPSRS